MKRKTTITITTTGAAAALCTGIVASLNGADPLEECRGQVREHLEEREATFNEDLYDTLDECERVLEALESAAGP